ncbi:hypothetical protein, variant [Aphanomyces invadans]|uniref:Spindle pole body component n=1 Tax=Aphanomyces invadans TaxID=157072 RepID=A0A024U2Q0_9STRA|nr:hypothetical protein, variant [Aphanomyces invadans]ETW00182.1 hypothetical protein, variant [Aphanomyces invadans]|eukprot:XP_008871207.1 hypothetical protein, variant [Aphanomyces invadans]
MSIPQWAATWRPDIRQLLHRLQDTPDTSSQAPSFAVDELQVDVYVRQLYAHTYLEPSSERMKNAAEGIVRTLEFHHRDRHAARISTIFFGTPDVNHPSRPLSLKIPTRIACLLLELANSPLSITPTELDEIDLVRIACESRSSKIFHDEQRAKAATRALVDELNHLTMEDPWFKAENADEEDDDALWGSDDDIPADESLGQLSSSQLPLQPNITNATSEVPMDCDRLSPKHDVVPSEATFCTASPEPEPPLPVEVYRSNKPWLLYQGYAEALGQFETPLRFLEKRILPEHHFVEHVLFVLLGCTSTTFESASVSSSIPFWSSMSYTKFELASSSLHLQSVSHLTPACLYQSLNHWSDVATALSFIRAAVAHLGSFPSPTMQGSSHALSEFVRGVDSTVSTHMRNMHVLGTSRPTLIFLWVELHPVINSIHWLRHVILDVLQPVEQTKTPTIRELATTVLTSLSVLLEQYTVLEDSRHYALLAQWFGHALTPYLQSVHDFLDGHPASLDVGFDLHPDLWTPFQRALFRTTRLPTSTTPPRFMHSLQSLLLEAHAYAIVWRDSIGASRHPTEVIASTDVMESQPNADLRSNASTPWRPSYVHTQIPPGLPHLTAAADVAQESTWMSNATQVPPLSFDEYLSFNVIEPLQARCLAIGHAMVTHVKDTWRVVDHWEAMRLFVLQYHPDTSSGLSEQLVQHVMTPALRPLWRDGYAMNAMFRHIVATAPATDADSAAVGESIAALNTLAFRYAAPGPLKLLFRQDVMDRLSKLGILLLQVQGVERALVSLKQTTTRTLPHVPAMHVHLVDLAGMLHFVKQMHEYFRQQTDCCNHITDAMVQATLVSEMNDAIERVLHVMLERCFLLKKHASIHQYLMHVLNQVIQYAMCFAQVVSNHRGEVDNAVEISGLAAAASKFKRAHGYLMIMLHSMARTGSAPHLHELVVQLNYNGVYILD